MKFIIYKQAQNTSWSPPYLGRTVANIPLQLAIGIRLWFSQHLKVLRSGHLVIKVVPHQPRLHPVVDDPAVPTDLIHNAFVAPSGIVVHINVAIVQVRDLLRGFLPRL